MATNIVHDLFHGKTNYVIAGSTEYFIMTVKNEKTQQPIDLSSVNNIEWFLGSLSVKYNQASVYKSLLNNDIVILKDTQGNLTNQIQVAVKSIDTEELQGGFGHQLAITDGSGDTTIPFEGIIVFGRKYMKV